MGRVFGFVFENVRGVLKFFVEVFVRESFWCRERIFLVYFDFVFGRKQIFKVVQRFLYLSFSIFKSLRRVVCVFVYVVAGSSLFMGDGFVGILCERRVLVVWYRGLVGQQGLVTCVDTYIRRSLVCISEDLFCFVVRNRVQIGLGMYFICFFLISL